MRFKKILTVLFGCLMLTSLAAFAACNQNEDNYSLDGLDKEDAETWFDEEKTDLPTLEQCRQISVGMSFDEVLRKLGKPQRYVGYETKDEIVYAFQFDTDNGWTMTLSFASTAENADDLIYDFLSVSEIDFEDNVPRYVDLNDLYPWINELKEEDIIKVRYEQWSDCVAPGTLNDVSYSTNSVDIENTYKLLSSSVQVASKYIDRDEIVDGGGWNVKYDFFTANGEKFSITFEDGSLRVDNQRYIFVDSYYWFKFSDVDCYSFNTHDFAPFKKYEIYTYGDEGVKIGDYDGIGEFEFKRYTGEIDKTPSYRLKSNIVDFFILSESVFMIENREGYYLFQITGEKDFSFLFND